MPNNAAIKERLRSSRLELIALSAILLLAFGLRMVFLHEPFERDEGFYSCIAQVILRGGIPYRDAIDLKPPGVFYVYAFAIALFGKTVASIRIFTAIYSLGTLGAVFWLARYTYGTIAGLCAAALFALYSCAPLVQASSSNSEVIMVLPLVLSACFFVVAVERRNRLFLLASGFFAGLAMLVKTVALPYVVLLFVCTFFLKGAERNFKERIYNAVIFVVPLLALALFTLGFFYVNGAFDEFILWNITIPLFYSKGGGVSGHGLTKIIKFLMPEFLMPVLVAVPTMAWLLAMKRDLKSVFIALLLPASCLGVWMPGKYFPHYFIQLIPFLSLLGGIGIAQLVRRKGLVLCLAGPLIAASFLYYVYKDYKYFLIFTPAEVSVIKYGPVFADSVYIADYIRARTTPSDYIFQWGFEPELYFLSDRPTPVPYISSTIFGGLPDPQPAIMSMVNSLNSKKPKYIIIQPGWDLFPGAEELSAIMARDYVLENRIGYALIYRRLY